MFKIELTNFRCFADPTPLEIRPITFLVGENSAGKTTFLAAVRQLLEGFARSPQNPFNRDPYFLGGFDQIAHYRGGVRGRAKFFSLQITVPATGEQTPRTRRQGVTTSHKFTFVKGFSQPELSEYEFVMPGVTARLILREKSASIKILRDGQEILDYVPKRVPPVANLRRDFSYIRFIFDAILFGQDEPASNAPQETQAVIGELIERFNESFRAVSRRVFASAPVRTQPLRTYTPSEIVASSEGSHVPLEMARQKISDPQEWGIVHERLAAFGKNSGLFEDIDIRTLGKRDGDPFQVFVKTKGPPVNLVDVRYGVSQALPIIYQLQQGRLHNAFLLQQPEVHLHPRAQAEIGTLTARLSRQRPNQLFVIETHSDYIIDRVRMEVARGTLDPKQVTIIFFDRLEHEVLAENLYVSDKGEIQNPPPNFRTFFLEEHARLLGV